MDAMEMPANVDAFAGTGLSNTTDHVLGDIWDWCVIKGCRSVYTSGRLYMKKGKWDKFK
jgi:hypothetical protein